MLPKCCTQYVNKSGRPSSGHRTGKGQSSSQFPRRVVAKNVLTIRHASKVMLKILHARLQHYVNQDLPVVQAGFRKGRGARDQIATFSELKRKLGNSKKNIYLCFIDCATAFHFVNHNKLENY